MDFEFFITLAGNGCLQMVAPGSAFSRALARTAVV
jgi:hypothetical protein